MNVLYLSSCHTTQEFDDLTILTELGVNWLSTGVYLYPRNPLPYNGMILRDPIPYDPTPDLIHEFQALNPNHGYHRPVKLTKAFTDKFDLVICSYSSIWTNNLFDIAPFIAAETPVVYRTYGFQSPQLEQRLQALKNQRRLILVRNSPAEKNLEGFAGEDFLIRGYVDENLYNNWIGNTAEVLTFSNDFSARLNHPNFKCYQVYLQHIYKELPAKLYGYNNHVVPNSKVLSWEDQRAAYRNHMVYFNLGSPPANLTYSFVEALMTGIPIVSIGKTLGSVSGKANFEVPDLLTQGVDGFYSDDPTALKASIIELLNDSDLRKQISSNGRKLALQLFSKESSKVQWHSLFEAIA